MLKECYELVKRIIEDDELNQFVKKTTNKNLVIINSNTQFTTPYAQVSFIGAEMTKPAENIPQQAQFSIVFGMPYFETKNAFELCLELIDIARGAFFGYVNSGCKVLIFSPSIVEETDSEDSSIWKITINATIKFLEVE